MPKGRPTMPTKLRLVRGLDKKRPTPVGEPMPTGEAERPAFLDGRAVDIWEHFAPKLKALGLLTPIDTYQFAAYCLLCAEMEMTGLSCPKMANLRALGNAFGMDPSARARMGSKPNAQTQAEAEYFVSRRQRRHRPTI